MASSVSSDPMIDPVDSPHTMPTDHSHTTLDPIVPVKRRAGRPKGSKNKTTLQSTQAFAISVPTSQIPDSSSAVSSSPAPKRGPGRPKGSKTKQQVQQDTTPLQDDNSDHPSSIQSSATPVRRGPGRPKGSVKKITTLSGVSNHHRINFPSDALSGSDLETPVPNSEINDDEILHSGHEMTDINQDGGRTAAAAPVKRKVGRPRKVLTEATLTDRPDSLAVLPQHELYFYNSKAGAAKTSAHAFPLQKLVGYDAANEWIQSLYPSSPSATQIPSHNHHQSVQTLHNLQASMFGQWMAEFEAGFNICAYGYGSKLYIARQFAKSFRLAISASSHPILMIDGFSADFSLRHVLTTIANFLVPPDLKLPSNVVALRDIIIQGLSSASPWKDKKTAPDMIILVINSIDATPIRTARTQSILADLASLAQIAILATADTPNFQLMWDADTRERFHMVFHDCTTFASFHTEADMVQTLDYVLGGKNRRKGGGIGGVEFVLKSLPANARSLFALLIAEQLEVIRTLAPSAGVSKSRSNNDDDDDDDDDEDGDGDPLQTFANEESGLGVEYHVLYTKMSDELICTSIHQFHTLLKEFVDHQLIEMSRDGSGATRLRVPFRRSELQTLLAQMDEE